MLRLCYVNTLQGPWLVTAGLLGRDVSCLNLMYCLGFCLEGLRKTTEPPDGWSGLKCGPEISQAVRSSVAMQLLCWIRDGRCCETWPRLVVLSLYGRATGWVTWIWCAAGVEIFSSYCYHNQTTSEA